MIKSWFPSFASMPTAGQFFNAYGHFHNKDRYGSRAIFEDKLALSSLLSTGGIQATETLFAISSGIVVSGGGLGIEHLSTAIPSKCFIKPRNAHGGKGACIVDGGLVTSAKGDNIGSPLDVLPKIIGDGEWLIQKVVAQHEAYLAPAPVSLNTVRCITYRTNSGSISVVAATFRMGSGKSVVDNASSGGLFAGVNIETGRLIGDARDTSGKSFSSHPVSGLSFDGYVLPNIEDIFTTCINAHRLVGGPPSVGWDVAMTPDGPCIVEGNTIWMGSLHSRVDGGFSERLWKLFFDDHKISGKPYPPSISSADPHQMVRVSFVVGGRVQGVGYRAWLKRQAENKGFVGSGENLADGSVRGRFLGPRRTVEFAVLSAMQGPEKSRVDRLDIEAIDEL